MIIKKDYHSKNVFNLCKKHLATLAFHYNSYAQFNRRRDHWRWSSCCSTNKCTHSTKHWSCPSADQSSSTSSIPTNTRHFADWIGNNFIYSTWLFRFKKDDMSLDVSEAEKQEHVTYFMAMLKKFDASRSKCVITCGESCFYYYEAWKWSLCYKKWSIPKQSS